jgi:acyl-CoA oxidase
MAGDASSALLPFLPLLYVAWSDGTLDLAELRTIFGRVIDVWKLDPVERDQVGRWLDPDQPPTPDELDEMLARVRVAASGLTAEDRRSLTELGLALARASGGGVSSVERSALEEIELALGGNGSPAVQALLGAVAATGEREGGRLRGTEGRS